MKILQWQLYGRCVRSCDNYHVQIFCHTLTVSVFPCVCIPVSRQADSLESLECVWNRIYRHSPPTLAMLHLAKGEHSRILPWGLFSFGCLDL